MIATSPAAVAMFALPGRIRLVALCVSVNAPTNSRSRLVPAAIASKAVIVVVAETVIGAVYCAEAAVGVEPFVV